MAQPAVHRRMTLAEFEALPEQKPYLEYVDGEVVQKPVPKTPHGTIQTALAHYLFVYAREAGGRASTEVHTYFETEGRTIVRVPDVLYWAPGTPRGDDERALPPTLAIEVRSLTQTWYNQQEKCRFMSAHGAGVCWLIDPDACTAEVYERGEAVATLSGDAVLESDHLPGFTLSLAELFAVLGN